MNVKRDYAGGMGVADPSDRGTFGHDPGYITLPYMSLLYTAGVLERAGHEVVFIDAQADNLDIPGVIERVREHASEVVVSVMNLPSVYGDLEVLQSLKGARPGVKVIAVGTVCIPLFDEIAASGAIDGIIQGDPEPVILRLFAAILPPGAACVSKPGKPERSRVPLRESKPGKPERSGVPLRENSIPDPGFEQRNGVLTNSAPSRVADLDALPPLPYHLVPIEKYRYHGFGKDTRFAAVFASRGCSFKCYYCPYPIGFGDCIVQRDPLKVIDEIEDLQVRYGVRGILFRDQVFTMDWDKTGRLCDEMIRRRLDVKWVVETRLDRVNEELLQKMKQAGCVRIHYGLESGDPELFSRVGKDGAEDRIETLIHNFIATERIGIHPHMFILIGLLGEDHNTIERTIGVIRRIKPLTLQVAIVTPYPGTPLFGEMKDKGLLLTEDWSQYTGFKPVARTEALSADDLEQGRQHILREHRRATEWKRRRHFAALACRYLCDGSLPRRLTRKIGRGN